MPSRLGALPGGMPEISPEYVKTVLPDSRARFRCENALKRFVVERKHTVFRCLDQEELLQLAKFAGHLGSEVVGLRVILGDVVELPVVTVYHIRQCADAHQPRSFRRGRPCEPAVMVDRPVSHDFEILRVMLGRGVRIRLVEGVSHAHAFDRLLRDAVDHDRCRNAAGFEKGRRNIDEMVELRAHATHVGDMTGPGDGQALPGAAEVRRYLLGPLERRVERPGPRYRHMRLSLDRTPVIVMLQLLCDWDLDGLKSSHVKGSSERRTFRAGPVVAAAIDD